MTKILSMIAIVIMSVSLFGCATHCMGGCQGKMSKPCCHQ